MRSLPIDRPTLDDPLYTQKNPHQVFLLLFVFVASLALVTTGESPSQVMNTQTNTAAQYLWAGALLVGSAMALVGEFWRGRTWTGLAIERGGLLLTGTVTSIFALVAWNVTESQTAYITSVSAAYGASCLWRALQITRRLRWIKRVVEEMNARHAGAPTD